MVSPNVDRLFQAMESLNDAERQELMRLLEQRSAQRAALTNQDRLRQALVERGIVEIRRRGTKDVDRFRGWRPVLVNGKPISQSILEERR